VMNILALTVCAAFLACAPSTSAQLSSPSHSHPLEEPPDLIFILSDDVGDDSQGPASTPNLDALQAAGITFDNFYCQTLCSPTRVHFLTGKQPLTNWGIGKIVDPTNVNPNPVTNPPLPLGAWTIAEMLKLEGYHTGAFGKWHVGNANLGYNDQLNPNEQGFDVARGMSIYGVFSGYGGGTNPPSNTWNRTDDGVKTPETEYATTVVVDEFVEWWTSTSSPRFAFVSFQAAHAPLHVPPASLTPSNPSTGTAWEKHRAMIEAMDTEIGRAMAVVDLERTVVGYAGDNGTPSVGAGPGVDTSEIKGSMYDGGISPPCFFVGPGVPAGATSQALISVGDVFATYAEFAGHVRTVPDESVSFAGPLFDPAARGLREHVISARRAPNGFAGPFSLYRRMVRTRGHKLIVTTAGQQILLGSGDVPIPFDPVIASELEQILTDEGF